GFPQEPLPKFGPMLMGEMCLPVWRIIMREKTTFRPRLESTGRVLAAVRNNPRLELVVAGCVVNKGKVLLVWHKKHKEWLPPGGHLEQNESPNDTVLRRFWKKQGFTSLSRVATMLR